MKKVRVTKIFSFDAAHHLEHHKGKCQYLHGHTYKLEVTVEGLPYPVDGGEMSGMLIDFSKLTEIVGQHIIAIVDHQLLNDIFDYTTAEYMAEQLFDKLEPIIAGVERIVLQPRLPLMEDSSPDSYLLPLLPSLRLHCIRLWETPTSYVEVCRD